MKLYPKFLRSATAPEHFPPPSAPEVAFLGRSNVGKSSLINALLGSKEARVSSTPGRTRAINFFALSDAPERQQPRLLFADLPGYGYARGGDDSVAELAKVSESYFAGGTAYRVAGVLHLVDARHPGLASDAEAADWLDATGLMRRVVATKIDKLSRAERARNLGELERKLGMPALPISARGGEGLDDLWRLIANLSRQQ